MADPVIEWYEAPDAAAPLASWDYGTVDAGTRSPPKKFYLYNNKGGSGASTATDVKYTTFDDASGGEAADVVAQKWLEVRIVSDNGVQVSDPDGGFKAVGGAQARKDLSAFNVENNSYLELETRVAVPANPAAGARSFVQRVEFKFT
jgi:hypothetical protein